MKRGPSQRGRSPRVRDDRAAACSVDVTSGRSPRVRGRLIVTADTQSYLRKIPARTGTTWASGTSGPWTKEDPRACGDDCDGRQCDVECMGRSPRVRERPQLPGVPARVPRKIPARAGTTTCAGAPSSTTPEDPRACGDDDPTPVSDVPGEGRSPRVRGRHDLQRAVRVVDGKIPARARTTRAGGRRGWGRWEDPRAYGDDRSYTTVSSEPPGRSPRVRGTTAPVGAVGVVVEEDPRACGDDRPRHPRLPGSPGRSPRVQGPTRRDRLGWPAVRKIPARAGTTQGRVARRGPCQEDPRACGDDRWRWSSHH